MFLNTRKISTLIGVLLFASLADTAGAATSYMNGSAAISYVNYNAEANGKEIYSGDSLAQKYSLAWSSTNLYYRTQPRYYSVTLGYDWTTFNTKINDNGTQFDISQTFGKFRYNGEIGYNPVEYPVRFKAFANNGETTRLQSNIYHGLMDDGFYYNIEGLTKGYETGFSFVFESDRALTAAMRQLPRVYIDYREVLSRPVNDVSGAIDAKTRELSVAGLNKENNWLQYRNIKYESYRNPLEDYERQLVQIGLVDQYGRRKWAALTNWINVSADGSFGNKKGTDDRSYEEEYDVNFQAIATRRNWEARTMMNYNREIQPDRITTKTRIPLYVKGIWSADIDWYANAAADRGREIGTVSGRVDTSYTNSVSFGGNMFKRSNFSISPAMAASTSKAFNGGDAYNIKAGVAARSTRYYSTNANLEAGYLVKYKDDGSGSASSTSWSNLLNFKADYRPTSRFSFTMREDLEYGKGSGFVNVSRLTNVPTQQGESPQYTRSVTYASLRYAPSAALSITFDGSNDYFKTTNAPAINTVQLSNSINYNKDDLSFGIATTYDKNDTYTSLTSRGQLQYKPNRYHDALVRATYDQVSYNGLDTTNSNLIQNYTYTMFTRSGLSRNIASISEEFSFTRSTINTGSTDTKYLLISGRYSPTSRISLYGSAKFQQDQMSQTMFYTAGAAMDFKLFTTTLDYYLAKRDSDNRVEKKFAATVRRSF